jgi:hypothetical protein
VGDVDDYERSERRRDLIAVAIVVIGLLVTVGIVVLRQRGEEDPFGPGTSHTVTLVREEECYETRLLLDDSEWRGLWRWPGVDRIDGTARIASESRVEFTADDGTMLEMIGGVQGEAVFNETCAPAPTSTDD